MKFGLKKKMQHPKQFLIFITGFMASGKTTFGKLLANYLRCSFVDIDELIAKKEHMSIAEIFSQKGEQYFRACELRIIASILDNPKIYLSGSSENYNTTSSRWQSNISTQTIPVIVSLGGGALVQQAIRKLLKQNSSRLVILWLQGSYKTLITRLLHTNDRPLFTTLNESSAFYRLYKKRNRLYKYCKTITLYPVTINHLIQYIKTSL